MPKISELTTAVPTGDDLIIFVDNADNTTKKALMNTIPGSNASGLVTTARNNSGATLFKGTIVYVTGGIGGNPTIAKARANTEATSSGTFWVVYADIPNNTNGTVLVAGKIDTLDTRTVATNPFTSNTLVDGDKLYLDPTTAGYVTNVKPTAPNHLVYIGTVTNANPTTGTIEYRIDNGFELDEIHDVLITSKTDWDLLVYESATTLWKNKSATTIGLVTASSTTTFTNKNFTSTTNVISQNTTTTSSATPAPTGWSLRNYFTVTALAAGATFSAPSGTPVDGNMLIVRIKDNGTARTLAWNAIYRGGDTALPATTILSKTLYLLFIYNGADARWDLISKEDNH